MTEGFLPRRGKRLSAGLECGRRAERPMGQRGINGPVRMELTAKHRQAGSRERSAAGVFVAAHDIHHLGGAPKGFDSRQSQVGMERAVFRLKAQWPKVRHRVPVQGLEGLAPPADTDPKDTRTSFVWKHAQTGHLDSERGDLSGQVAQSRLDLFDLVGCLIAQKDHREMLVFHFHPRGMGLGELDAFAEIIGQTGRGSAHGLGNLNGQKAADCFTHKRALCRMGGQ